MSDRTLTAILVAELVVLAWLAWLLGVLEAAAPPWAR